jgi:hypothetical protein
MYGGKGEFFNIYLQMDGYKMESYLTIGAVLAFLLAMLCVYCCKRQTEHEQEYQDMIRKRDRNHLI